MNKEQFYKHLKRILSLLKETKTILKAKPLIETRSERKQTIKHFMGKYLELYLLLRNEPSLKLDSKYKDFIEQSQHFLRSLIFELNDYVNDLEKRTGSTYYASEWEEIVGSRRSAIEAVKEMYRGTCFEEFYEGDNPEALDLNTEDLDELIEMKGKKEGYLKEDKIPAFLTN